METGTPRSRARASKCRSDQSRAPRQRSDEQDLVGSELGQHVPDGLQGVVRPDDALGLDPCGGEHPQSRLQAPLRLRLLVPFVGGEKVERACDDGGDDANLRPAADLPQPGRRAELGRLNVRIDDDEQPKDVTPLRMQARDVDPHPRDGGGDGEHPQGQDHDAREGKPDPSERRQMAEDGECEHRRQVDDDRCEDHHLE